MYRFFLISSCLLFSIWSCSDKAINLPGVSSFYDSSTLPIPAACGSDLDLKNYRAWKLIFNEEFNTDLNKWDLWNSGAYNNELQYYRPQNAILNKGFLFIKSNNEEVMGATRPGNATLKKFNYTSARLESKEIFGPNGNKAIRIVARIQVPQGIGLWPAFWTYNDPYPSAGEIDILEARGHETNKFQSVYHFGDENGLKTNDEKNNFYYQLASSKKDFSQCFYIYEAEWGNGTIKIYLDGKLLHTFKEPKNEFLNQLMNKKHRLILNLAVGGGFFRNLDVTKIAPKGHLIIDWVKVYSR